MRWLITGGCGFIGTSLIRELLTDEENWIRVVDNLSVGTRSDLSALANVFETSLDAEFLSTPTERIELVVGDILDDNLALRTAQGCDVIVHLAANTGVGPSVENPRQDLLANVVGTFNYLEAARQAGIRRFIFASSGAPIGECVPPIHEEMAPHPVSPYGASKLAGEGYCSAYFRTYGVETVGLRFGNVYGPGSGHKSSVIAKFIRNAIRGEPLEIYGDGSQTRDFIYIGDLICAIRRAEVAPDVGGEVFQIATSAETAISELITILIDVLRKNGIKDVSALNSHPRTGDVRRNYSDTSKAARMLEWKSKTSLEAGLDVTVRWFLDKHAASLKI